MVINSSDKFSKLRTVLFKVLCIVLTLSLVTTIFTISATAGVYTDVNKSGYHIANWFGLDELPYGTDTGVFYMRVEFYDSRYPNEDPGHKDLTFFFNKLSILDNFRGNLTTDDLKKTLVNQFSDSHCFSVKLVGADLKVSFISDSPVYYTWGDSWDTFIEIPASQRSIPISITDTQGNLTSTFVNYYYAYDVSMLEHFDWNSNNVFKCYFLSNVMLLDWNSFSSSELIKFNYKNPLMSQFIDNGGSLYRYTGITPTSTYDFGTPSYFYRAFPTSECLRDWQLYKMENSKFDELISALSASDYSGLLTRIADNTDEIKDSVNKILNPEAYPDSGMLNDNTYSSQVDGVVGDVEVNTDASEYITTLSASFIVIRGIWDNIVNSFGFAPVIGLLLFLAFVAYLLGRALKGRSD